MGALSNLSLLNLSYGYVFQLDGRHVVFGKVIEGKEVVQAIEGQGSSSGTPKTTLTITSSGIVDVD
jgi:cyclophilin family peptidyl-prolyl cis-trans isomerase